MTKISIQLNDIVRNVNKQILKYYVKDIDKTFNDKGVDLNVNNFIETLPFKNKKERERFLREDYAFEINGSANAMAKGLMARINAWLLAMHDSNETDADLSFFALKEHDLLLQSTYFFLGKLGSRVRETFFPIKNKEVWNRSDAVITNDKEIVNSKPLNKVVIFIDNHSNNAETIAKCDMVYSSLDEVIEDKDFLPTIHKLLQQRKKKQGIISNIKNKIIKFFQ